MALRPGAVTCQYLSPMSFARLPQLEGENLSLQRTLEERQLRLIILMLTLFAK
jgi:hypothetical protein